jgi:hypothetical protein
MFESTSRYANVKTATLTVTDEEGRKRVIAYKLRRFVPPASSMTELLVHTVVQGDRLDNITARYLGDPTQFWRVCDANTILDPAELTDKIGRAITIALPKG